MRNAFVEKGVVVALFFLSIVGAGGIRAAFQPPPAVDRDGRFGTAVDDFSADVEFDAAGNSYHMVSTDGAFPGRTSAGGRDIVIRKLDPAGVELWTVQFGSTADDNYGRTLAVTPTGTVAVVGYVTNGAFPGFTFLGGVYDAFFALYDTDGNQIVIDQFGTASQDQALGVETDGTNFFVTGYTDGTLPGHTSVGGRDGFVRVYDASGVLTNEIQFGTSGSDTAQDVALDGSGNVFVTGFTSGAFSTPIGGNDGFVAKFDPTLSLLASSNHGTTANDNYKGIDVGAGGHVVVTGSTFGAIAGQTPSGWDILIEGIDPATTASTWIRQFGLTSSLDSGEDVAVAPDGTSNACGNTHGIEGLGTTGNSHAFAIALDATGADLWADQFNTTAGGNINVYGCGLDPASGIALAGYTKGTFGGAAVGGFDAIYRVYEPFSSGVLEISACGAVASTPGEYRVVADLSGSGTCIEITANDVVLDLNGRTLTVQDPAGGPPSIGVSCVDTSDVTITDTGGTPGKIVVEAGTGIDASRSTRGRVDTISVELDTGSLAAVGFQITDSVDFTIQSVSGTDRGTGNVGITGADTSGTAVSIFDWALESAGSDGTGIALSGATNASIVEHNYTNAKVDLDGQGFAVDAFSAMFSEPAPADPGLSFVRFRGDGTVTDLSVTGGSFEAEGAHPNVVQFGSPTIFDWGGALRIGPGVQMTGPVFRREPGNESAHVRIADTSGTSWLASATFVKALNDRTEPLVIADPGASVDWNDAVTVVSFDPDDGSTVGSVEFAQDTIRFGDLTANVGFRLDNTADSPAQLASGAAEVIFRTDALSNSTGLLTYRDGLAQTPPCLTLPDGNTTTCPAHGGDSVFRFAHQTADTCVSLATPDVVVALDSNLSVGGGSTCLDLQASVTVDCMGFDIEVDAGSPGAESVGVRLGSPGAGLRNCDLRLLGPDAVGASIEADDADLRDLDIEMRAGETIGLTASAVARPTIANARFTAPGPAGTRTGIDLDAVTDLTIDGSTTSAERAYVMRVSGTGFVYESIWVGDIELGPDSVVWEGGTVDGGIDPDGRVTILDSFSGETATFVPADAEAIRNLATAFGPEFIDSVFEVESGRQVGILEENLTAGATFTGSVVFRSNSKPGIGVKFGEIEFRPVSPVFEDGLPDPWAFTDRDTVGIGASFAGEPSFDVRFEWMDTPPDPAAAKLFVEGSGDDAFLTGACATISATDAPWVVRCDRDLGQPSIQPDRLDLVYCGDGIVNGQVANDQCDPGAAGSSGKCLADCSLPPAPPVTLQVAKTGVPEQTSLSWNAHGAPSTDVFRSTDPGTVLDPGNLVGNTGGTTFLDTAPVPAPGSVYFYRAEQKF